jgi:hypothetical protein
MNAILMTFVFLRGVTRDAKRVYLSAEPNDPDSTGRCGRVNQGGNRLATCISEPGSVNPVNPENWVLRAPGFTGLTEPGSD